MKTHNKIICKIIGHKIFKFRKEIVRLDALIFWVRPCDRCGEIVIIEVKNGKVKIKNYPETFIPGESEVN